MSRKASPKTPTWNHSVLGRGGEDPQHRGAGPDGKLVDEDDAH
jgi:hypothetical protein